MGAMPGLVAKGPILARLEKWLNTEPVAGADSNFKQFKAMWEDPKVDPLGFGQMNGPPDGSGGIRHILGNTGNDRKHVDKHWWSGSERWFPRFPIQNILRKSFIEAYGHCRDKTDGKLKDISIFWVCPAPRIEVVLLNQPNRLTFLLITPAPPVSPYDDYGYTSKDAEIISIRFTQTGAGEEELVQPPAVPFVEVVKAKKSTRVKP